MSQHYTVRTTGTSRRQNLWETPYSPILTDYQREGRSPRGEGVLPTISLPDPTQYFNPQLIQNLYNIMLGNLSRAEGGAGAAARRAAASYAGASGLANPGAFIAQAGIQATAPFAQAYGQAEMGRAGALQNLQSLLFDAQTKRALAERDWERYGQEYQLAIQKLQLERDRLSAGIEQGRAGAFDYAGLGVNALMAIATLAKLGAFCWIAEELFGEDDERTHYARYAVNMEWPKHRLGRIARNLYSKYGRKIAKKIQTNRILRLTFKIAFEFIWRHGRKCLRLHENQFAASAIR